MHWVGFRGKYSRLMLRKLPENVACERKYPLERGFFLNCRYIDGLSSTYATSKYIRNIYNSPDDKE
jgi:hypothetical protein